MMANSNSIRIAKAHKSVNDHSDDVLTPIGRHAVIYGRASTATIKHFSYNKMTAAAATLQLNLRYISMDESVTWTCHENINLSLDRV
ncbi:unnamed protein product [Adineta ricciae]|uniref:Uncharacterized protein n=1 Tax=Adineta ricciae TaxID=249248 RepID=A0A815G5K6_ADIRI|nr:unnamed protein product [Adineta ricciae]